MVSVSKPEHTETVIEHQHPYTKTASSSKPRPKNSKPDSTPKPHGSNSGGEKWTAKMEALSNEIKVRHYSPKTLKSYSTWVRKLQSFLKSKNPDELSTEDVKSFLTFLAVDQKVSASSQNQAFNALLFFFRNVLDKEFGKIDGVVRAKRKPYIPVVLSRKEIDAIIENLKYPYNLIV